MFEKSFPIYFLGMIFLLAMNTVVATQEDEGLFFSKGCVVLLYHNFSDTSPESTSISPKLFAQHLQYLQENNFKVLSLETMLRALELDNLVDKCVVLTADDAYFSIAKNAYPILKKYQMPMSVFVSTNAVDKQYGAMMSWQQMRDIQGKIIKFYNHSSTHPHLLELNEAQIKSEVEDAQNRLNKELRVRERIFAYPYGEANFSIMRQLKEMGFYVFGQHSGVVSNMSNKQNLPRFPMAGEYAKMPSFKTKVNALPMPIVAKKINPIFTQNPPKLMLEFKKTLSKHQLNNFNCFASGGTEVDWKDDKNVVVIGKQPLKQRRNKYNCTMPSQKKDRYYWYSVQWVNPDISE